MNSKYEAEKKVGWARACVGAPAERGPTSGGGGRVAGTRRGLPARRCAPVSVAEPVFPQAHTSALAFAAAAAATCLLCPVRPQVSEQLILIPSLGVLLFRCPPRRSSIVKPKELLLLQWAHLRSHF
ncbi:Hypothetical predicted protein [Cloeon dipterum]|uniref:Uncharacterized protein n=1 Tax=Cloeon dipterum TaxID=197152 RepID=A0A8S1CUU8_9INSE|nr:Hypothetical predicted protein [Cloeon dipterum]